MATFRLFGRTIEVRDSLANPSKWLTLAFGGGTDTAAGLRVNEVVALRNTTVMACVNVIAQTVAQLPLPIYRRLSDGGRERAPEHPLYQILDEEPNDKMSAFTFWETLMAHLLTWGNAYAYIDYDNAGRVKSLYPLLPDRTRPQLDKDGNLVYLTRVKNDPNSISPTDNRQIVLSPRDVLHIPGLGFDGLKGYSVIAQAREAIGLGLALEEYAARFFGNGAIPGLVFKTDKNLSPEQRKLLETVWQENHQGLQNAQRIAILESGLQVEKIGIPPEDAQFLESRKFSRNEITAIFRIPPHMVGDIERTTSWGSGIEQQAIGFKTYTMAPWFRRIEQSINRRLFTPTERKVYYCEFLSDALVRGDIATRTAAYKAGIEGGWMTPNEVREAENRNTYEGGDFHFIPMNFQAIESLDATGAPPADPNAVPAPDQTSPSAASAPATDVRFIEPLLTDLLERALKRQRVDSARKAYDAEDITAFLRQGMKPLVEALSRAGVDGVSWASDVVQNHVGESTRLLGSGDELGREAAFGTSTTRAQRETSRAMLALPRADAPQNVGDPMWLALKELANRPPAVVNVRSLTPEKAAEEDADVSKLTDALGLMAAQNEEMLRLLVDRLTQPLPAPRQADVHLHIDPGAIVTNVAPPNLNIEKGAISAPTTIAEGAVRIDMPKSKGKKIVYDKNNKIVGTEEVP